MRRLSSPEIDRFQRDGYLIVDTGIPTEILDGVVTDLADYLSGAKTSQELAYADSNRIQDAWVISKNVRTLAIWPQVLDVLADLYDKTPLPFQTLNFPRGTEQPAHSDSIHFNSEPFGLMCGVWIALEDIGPDQGPLVYYPGSQKLPEMNFEDIGLKADYSEYAKYEEQLRALIETHNFQPELGLVKKGSAIIWSANLLHGGSRQNDKKLTRYSQVTHYFLEGAKPWRPGHSEQGRAYFEPRWIPLVDAPPPPGFFTRVKNAIGRRLPRRVQ